MRKRHNEEIIAIDFDGSVVTHMYPYIGHDIGAVPVLKKLIDKGHKLMLWTMRGNKKFLIGDDNIDTLQDAIDWFKSHDIPLWGINQNPDQKKSGWSNSHKQYATLYIDDAALGAPLRYDYSLSERGFLDWDKIELMLKDMNLI